MRSHDENVDFCQHRNDVRPVMATFLVMAGLLVTTLKCIIIHSAYVHVWSAEK